jgi:hypothetical protein
MMYNEAKAQQQDTAYPSLLTDTSNLVGGLKEAEARIQKLADALFGPEPREVGAPGSNVPEPVATVRRNIDTAERMVGRLHDAINRIEKRV